MTDGRIFLIVKDKAVDLIASEVEAITLSDTKVAEDLGIDLAVKDTKVTNQKDIAKILSFALKQGALLLDIMTDSPYKDDMEERLYTRNEVIELIKQAEMRLIDAINADDPNRLDNSIEQNDDLRDEKLDHSDREAVTPEVRNKLKNQFKRRFGS